MTLLRVVHGDLAFSPLTAASVGSGWPYVLDGLKSLVETGTPLPPRYARGPAPDAETTSKDWHRQQAAEANNATFDLLESEPFDAEAALRGAYAAAFHWDRVASKRPENEVRALYLIGKAWLAAGSGERALDYGDRCLTGCVAAGLVDFDLTYAHELRARALHALGREDEARLEWTEATSIAIRQGLPAVSLQRGGSGAIRPPRLPAQQRGRTRQACGPVPDAPALPGHRNCEGLERRANQVLRCRRHPGNDLRDADETRVVGP